MNILIFKGFDPVLLQHGLNSPIPLHYIISNDHCVVHVLVLYERPGKFWWAGGYKPTDKELVKLYNLGMKKEDLYMIILSAAFDKYGCIENYFPSNLFCYIFLCIVILVDKSPGIYAAHMIVD